MWIQISAGLAPIESCRFVYLFLQLVKKECEDKGIKLELLDYSGGDEKDTLKSVFLRLTGDGAKEYASAIEGSMLWIWESRYRKSHKRKNWFIEVEVFDSEEPEYFDLKQIKIETMRSSGNGGQNVNKLETGVRITHIPTGIVVKAQEERSQHANIKLAKIRLKRKLEDTVDKKAAELLESRWQKHKDIKRGEPVRTFKGDRFIEIL